MAVGVIDIEVRPDLTKFKQQIHTETSGIGNEAGETAGSNFGGKFKTAALVGAAAVGTGIVAALGIGAKVAGDLEQSKIAFETLFADTAKAEKFLGQLKDFAAKTPFDLPGLTSASQKLASAGIEADKILPIMETLGDSIAAMGGNSEQIDRATLALQQMALKGKVSGEEMLQLAEAGVPAWDALASKMGVTVAEAQDKVSKGLVGYTTLYDALGEKSGAALQRTAGAMDKQSQSFQGLMSTLQDTLQIGLATALGPALTALKPLLGEGGALMTILTSVGQAIAPIAEVLVKLVQTLAPILKIIGDAVVKYLTPLAQVFGKILEAVAPLVTALVTLAADVLTDVQELIGSLITAALPLITAILEPLARVLLPALTPLFDALGGALRPVIAALTQVIAEVAPALGPVFEQFALMIAEVLTQLTPLLPSLSELLLALIPLIIPLTQIAIDLMPLWTFQIQSITTVLPWLVNGVNLLLDVLIQLVNGIVVVVQWIANLVSWITSRLAPAISSMTDIGRNIVVGLWNGIASLIGWLGSNVSSIIGTISNAIGSFYNSAYNIGRNLIIGMWDGIASLIGWLRDKVSGFAGGLVKSITGFFGIHSPSRLMATAVGIPLAQGIGVGFAAAMPGVASSMLAQLDGLTRGAPSGVAALSGALQGRQGGSGGAPTVAVYIGSEQLTDIVRTEIRRTDDELATTLSGRMR